jgi:ketosteroid isomerase-like protein
LVVIRDQEGGPMPAKQPSEWMTTWNELFAKGDVDGILSLYEPDAVFVGEPGQTAPVFPDTLRAVINQFLSMNGSLKLDTKSSVQTGNMAVTYGPWTFDGTTPDGPLHIEAVATAVLVEGSDGNWRAKIDDFYSEG